MKDINLDTILSRIPTSTSATKTASDKEGNKEDKDEVSRAKKDVESAVAEANKKEENTPCETKTAQEKVAAAEKLASELLDADTDSMLKLAKVMGASFEEGRLTQSAIHAEAAQALENEYSMPKTAEEAQQQGYLDGVQTIGAVIDTADAGYANVMQNVEKLAADIEYRGYQQADFLIKKAQQYASRKA